jgi:uncharacterized membrane protein
MTPLSRKLLLVFGAIGLAASAASSYVHYKLLTQPDYTSFCDVSTTVSCTEAYISRYGSLWGAPVALLGVCFFVLVLLLAGWSVGRGATVDETTSPYIGAVSMVGLAFVMYLGWASYLQLKVFCLLCAITYVSVIAVFIVSHGAATVPMMTIPRRILGDVRALLRSPRGLLAAVLFLAGAFVLIGLFPQERTAAPEAVYPPLTDQQRSDLEKWWNVQPEIALPIPKEGAKVLIVKFSDYMCPGCRETYAGYKGLLNKYLSGGQVRYVVKHFPLEAECNPSAPSNHYASCEAAAAVIMARKKGTADTLEAWIFANQVGLTAESVKRAAKEIGGIPDFDQQYARALEAVKADVRLGGQLGVNQTPTFYINGRKVPGPTLTPPPYFDYLVELALKQAG